MKVKALAACNGGGKPMTIGKTYDIPEKDAKYLLARGKAELLENDSKKAPEEKKGVDSKSGLKG